VPGCLSRRAAGAPFSSKRCEYRLSDGISVPARVAQDEAARGLSHIGFVDMTDRFCDRELCSAVRSGAIVFRDDDHLTATFSRNEAPELGARISAAVAQLSR
jgi:hypothetical protein